MLDRAAPGATLLLNSRHRPGRGLGRALAARCRSRSSTSGIELYVIDASRVAREAGLAAASTRSCRPASSRSRACCSASEAISRDQGGDREDATAGAAPRSYAQPRRGRPRPGRPAPGRVARSGDVDARAAAGRARARAGVRADRNRGDDGRPRRPAAGQRAARRRHIPERHGRVGETQHLRASRRLGPGALHPVRQLQLRLPAQRDPLKLLRAGRARRRAGRLPLGAAQRTRAAGAALHAAGLRRGLHRLRAVRRGVPGRRAAAIRAQGDQPRRRASRLEDARARNIAFFETLPASDRARVDFGTVRGTQFLEPLFEFSGACAGCGETPYLKLLSQLFGDRLMVANATGCSSIYGGNLPTTPWTTDARRARPGVVELAVRGQRRVRPRDAPCGRPPHRARAPAAARAARRDRRRSWSTRSSTRRSCASPSCAAQRERVAELKRRLRDLDGPAVDDLRSVVDHLVRRSVWIVGGDGWAYDIGSGGLDHVLASGQNVNVLVLDTEVYSNTGGQMSKATPLGAVAKFAAAGKTTPKKDLALQAIALRQRLRRARGDGRRPAADAAGAARGRGLRRHRRWSSLTATASRTATTCATAWTSSTARSPAATGR